LQIPLERPENLKGMKLHKMALKSLVPRWLAALRNQKWFPIMCSAVWLGTTVAGLGILWRSENTPGIRMAVPAQWPVASRISPAPGIATLVMFAHPRCPCARAGVGELERIIAQCNGRVRAHVIFYKPNGSPDEWAHTDLWRSAAAVPGVDVHCDEEGAEAARFGATTSGFVVLYDALGQLRFNGGITAERGHAGDNEGRSAIVAILNGQPPHLTAMPVFGCSLFAPGSKCLKGATLCTK
jgi:hypothetical protein